MFVQQERNISCSFGELRGEFNDAPEEWLPEVAERALRDSDGITARMGTAALSKRVKIQIGAPNVSSARAVMPIRVVATGPSGLFPQLDADLELVANGSSAVKLRLSGSYRTPLGSAGRLLDRALLHRVADASITNFLEQVAERLQHQALLTDCV